MAADPLWKITIESKPITALTRQYDLLRRHYDELLQIIARPQCRVMIPADLRQVVKRQKSERDRIMDELEREG